MNKFLLWAIICLFSWNASAQKFHTIKARIDTEPRIEIPNRLFFIHHVADARQDTSIVGIVQTGLFNQKTKAVLEYGSTKFFEKIFEGYLDINMDDKLQAITMVIRELQVSEWTAFAKETGYLEIGIDFYAMQGDSLTKKIFTAEVLEENAGMDVTAGHTTRIRRGITKALTQLNEFLQNPQTKPALYSDIDQQLDKIIAKNNLETISYSDSLTVEDDIHTCTNRRFGLYKNIDELRLNRPSLLGDVKVELSQDGRNVRLRHAQTNILLKGRFVGFCDGTDIYMNAQTYQSQQARYFCKVTTFGTLWAWEDHFIDSNDLAMYSLFGVVGAIINDAKREYDCVVLNWKNKVIAQALPSTIEMLIDDAELLQQYRSGGSQRNGYILTNLVKTYNQIHPLK